MDPGEDGAGFDLEQVDTDIHGNRNRHADGKHAPGIIKERIHNGHAQTGQCAVR